MKREKGQGLVEFALILPILLLTVLLFIYFSDLFHTWSAIQSAAVVGSRQAARSGDVSQVEQVVFDHLEANAVDVQDVEVKILVLGANGHPRRPPPNFGDFIEVQVSKPFDIKVLSWHNQGVIQGVHRLICEHGQWTP